MSGDTTADEESRASAALEGQRECLALIIAHSLEEPERVGEVAFVARDAPGPAWLFGRGPARDGDRSPKLAFGPQRPGGEHGCAPLAAAAISRSQLAVRNLGAALEVENVGRRRLAHNGHAVQRARVVPGDLLQIGASLLLLCELRPLQLAWPGETYRSHAFGGPDSHGIVGESPAIWKLRRELAYVAAQPGHVLLLGASGTGKELAANALHALSPWSEQPLVARNAATIPEGIADAELFGNAKNYPNAGMPLRSGLVGEADGSTLFLDEFAELPQSVQARLLRVLDGGEYQRLGESQARRSRFRLVAASNRPESALKLDLAARFRFRIQLPDLNARRSDIPLLLRQLHGPAQGPTHVPPGATTPRSPGAVPPLDSCALVAACLQHVYTTHVRELAGLALSGVPGAPHRGDAVSSASNGSTAPAAGDAALTPAVIQAMLDRHNGMIEATWRALGLKNRHVLVRLVAKHQLEIRRRPRM